MHSKKIKLLSIFLLISFLFTLTSCLLNLDRGKKIYKAIFVYLDDPVVEDDNLKIDFTASSYSYSLNNGNVDLSVKMYIKNNTTKTQKYQFKDYCIIKESTGAKYTLNHDWTVDYLEIEAELTDYTFFESTIPSTIEDDNYKMEITVDRFMITLYLYNRPNNTVMI